MFYCSVTAFRFKQSEITGEVLSDTMFKPFSLPHVKQFMIIWLPNPAGEDKNIMMD